MKQFFKQKQELKPQQAYAFYWRRHMNLTDARLDEAKTKLAEAPTFDKIETLPTDDKDVLSLMAVDSEGQVYYKRFHLPTINEWGLHNDLLWDHPMRERAKEAVVLCEEELVKLRESGEHFRLYGCFPDEMQEDFELWRDKEVK